MWGFLFVITSVAGNGAFYIFTTMKDELDLDTLLDDEQPQGFSGKRPVFLQVLCILTFIGAGLGILGAVINIFTIGQMEETMTSMNDIMGDFDDSFSNMYRWQKISYVLNLVGSLMCLAGALIMWRLRKYGYYIYVFGQVLPLVGAFMTFNSLTGIGSGLFGGFGVIMMVFTAVFPIAFIIMYGLNLKHMR